MDGRDHPTRPGEHVAQPALGDHQRIPQASRPSWPGVSSGDAGPRSARRKRVLFMAKCVTLAQVVRLKELAEALDPARHEVLFAASSFDPINFAGTRFERHTIQSISPQTMHRRVARGARLYDQATLTRYVHEVTVRGLRAAVGSLLSDDATRERAANIGLALRRLDARARFAELVANVYRFRAAPVRVDTYSRRPR